MPQKPLPASRDASDGIFVGGRCSPTIKIILLIYALVYTLQVLCYFVAARRDFLAVNLALNVGPFHLWQLVTFLLVHFVNPFQITANLLVLSIISGDLERSWGWLRFLAFYLMCGISGGLVAFALYPHSIQMGATPAVLGVLAAFAYYYPQRRFYGGIPARQWAWGIGLLLLLITSGVTMTCQQRHLTGGQVPQVALAYSASVVVAVLWTWGYQYLRRRLYYWKVLHQAARIQQIDILKEQVDELLEKISREGFQFLSRAEKRFLRKASVRIRQAQQPSSKDKRPLVSK